VNLEIGHYYNGVQKTAFDHMVQEFNETIGLKKGIIVEAFSQGNISDLTEKVVDAANKKVGAEDIPDIFAAYADTAYVVNQLGLVAELDRGGTE
jgi:multiple sugar transport system substrate-binding protein